MRTNQLPIFIFILISAYASNAQNAFLVNTKGLEQSTIHVPARVITNGPKHHWFGYYDKLQFDPTNRFILGMEVNFEDRSPKPEDEIKVGMVDIKNQDRWIELGQSKAWGWQQGCMLQFVPGSDSLVIWNDRINQKFVSHLFNIYTKKEKILPFAIYALSPDGVHAVTTDFERIQDTRPGYGYAGIPDPNRDELAPDDAGIYLCNLQTGEKKLIITYKQMQEQPMMADKDANHDRLTQKNWFNHLLFNTDGSRFIFLHRWKAKTKKDVGGFATLMYTSDLEGKNVHLVDPSNYTSHFIWRDKEHIAAWTRQPSDGPGFYVFTDGKPEETYVLNQEKMPVNGHNTYLPGNEWILNDSYPDKNRFQHVYLYNVTTDQKVPLGDFYLAPEYRGEWRCDTHPRSSRNGKLVCIDCPTATGGRQLILMDISDIVE
jgi:heme-degrading monooxygenase HmoA